MNHPCRVPGCGAPASSQYSPHCKRHKSNLRRQGGVTQRSISKTELAPYLDRVRARAARNPNSSLWGILDDAWAAEVATAQTDANARVANRYQRQAAREVTNIASDASSREIGIISIAMFMLRHDQPRRFETDRAFWQQISRRVRALSQRHVGIGFNHQTGSNYRLYREITPRAAILLGHILGRCFGVAGIQMAELEQRERDAARQTAQSISNAIKELN